MKHTEWQMSRVAELDLTSTELSSDCLQDILCRAGAGFTYLGLGYCEFFNDQVSAALCGTAENAGRENAEFENPTAEKYPLSA